MTAELPSPNRSAIPRVEIESALKQCNQSTLEAMLRVIQLRLGVMFQEVVRMQRA